MTPITLWNPSWRIQALLLLALAGAALAILLPSVAAAQSSGGPYTLTRVAFASGGAVSGGTFTGRVSIGEPGAGPTSTGGAYTMTTGFLAGVGSSGPTLSTTSTLPQIFKQSAGGW